jgi:phospholipase A-2-activating protein
MNEEYVLSKSFLSADGEPVRSMCYITAIAGGNAAASTGGSAAASATAMDTSDDGTAGGETVAIGSQGGIVTQLCTAGGSNGEVELTTFQGGHSHGITAMLALPDSTKYVTGCKDNHIRIFDASCDNLATKAPIQVLQGHGNAVTSLTLVTLVNDKDSSDTMTLLVSGSWDGSAKCWSLDAGMCVCTMGGHENTVCVQGLPPPTSSSSKPSSGGPATYRGCLATASAGVAQGNAIVDMKLRIWDIVLQEGGAVQSTLRHTIQDHQGPIRDLCLDPTTLCLASVSNDGTLKLRDSSTGKPLNQLVHPGTNEGSPPLILSVAALGNGRFVTGTEDGCVFVWDSAVNATTPVHTILHPNCVWRVASIPNNLTGDFMTACHDGQARIFSLDGTRLAPPNEIEAFQHAVTEAIEKKQKAAAGGGGPSPEEVAKLPDWHTARYSMTGKSEGQVQLFRKDAIAIAAQWSMASGTWIEVGEVTGSNEHAGTIDGVSYDHVFPIEVDVPGGGLRNLQIGYNTGENPFVTAQQFIDTNELDQNYLAQIADYIRQRAGETNTPPTLGMGDATACSGAPASAYTAPAAVPTYQYLPMKGYRLFESGTDKTPLSKVLGKVREFNENVPQDQKLSSEQCGDLLEGLAQTLSATNRYHSSSISNEELNVIGHILSNWPSSQAFPALDLARMIVLHPDATSRQRTAYWTSLISTVLERHLSNVDSLEGTAAVAIPMLSMRLSANAFKGFGSNDAIASHLKAILHSATVSCAASGNKNVRLSVATIALNASSHMLTASSSSSPPSSEDIEALLKLLEAILTQHVATYESEAISRTLLAFGTMLLLPGVAGQSVKAQAASLNLTSSLITSVAEKHGETAKGIATEIATILN